MKKTSKLITYALMTSALLLFGCAAKQQTQPVSQICIPLTDKAIIVQAAEEVLSKMNFKIEKADPCQGFVKTHPLSGAQWFEFWRSDNVGSFNKTEANIQSIRRTVELNISPQADKLCVDCIAGVQRLSLPERNLTGNTRAYGLFTKSNKTQQNLLLDSEQKKNVEWVELGRDTALETEILKRLERKIAGLQKEK